MNGTVHAGIPVIVIWIGVIAIVTFLASFFTGMYAYGKDKAWEYLFLLCVVLFAASPVALVIDLGIWIGKG